MRERFLVVVSAITIACIGLSRPAQATTITFDDTITNLGGTFNALPLGIDYLPNASPNITFTTQGFDFGGVGSCRWRIASHAQRRLSKPVAVVIQQGPNSHAG